MIWCEFHSVYRHKLNISCSQFFWLSFCTARFLFDCKFSLNANSADRKLSWLVYLFACYSHCCLKWFFFIHTLAFVCVFVVYFSVVFCVSQIEQSCFELNAYSMKTSHVMLQHKGNRILVLCTQYTELRCHAIRMFACVLSVVVLCFASFSLIPTCCFNVWVCLRL